MDNNPAKTELQQEFDKLMDTQTRYSIGSALRGYSIKGELSAVMLEKGFISIEEGEKMLRLECKLKPF